MVHRYSPEKYRAERLLILARRRAEAERRVQEREAAMRKLTRRLVERGVVLESADAAWRELREGSG